jgi:hypothetical protein
MKSRAHAGKLRDAKKIAILGGKKNKQQKLSLFK